jgi:hypothetical protein
MTSHARAIDSSEAARILADPAEHDEGELVEVKDSSDRRFLARVIRAGPTLVDIEVLGRIVPDHVLTEA